MLQFTLPEEQLEFVQDTCPSPPQVVQFTLPVPLQVPQLIESSPPQVPQFTLPVLLQVPQFVPPLQYHCAYKGPKLPDKLTDWPALYAVPLLLLDVFQLLNVYPLGAVNPLLDTVVDAFPCVAVSVPSPAPYVYVVGFAVVLDMLPYPLSAQLLNALAAVVVPVDPLPPFAAYVIV